MSSHRVTIHHEPDGHRAICVCRARSAFYPNRWQAQDWELSHMDLVERVKTHLTHGRTVSLASQRDYFRFKETDPTTPRGDVPLWRQLADEVDKRLGNAIGDGEQAALW